MIPPDASGVSKVTKQRLREIWNDPAFQSTLLSRTQQRVDVAEGLAPPDAGQEPGTMSHVYDYMNNDAQELLGTFHVYKKPDGTIGASGLFDPIFLLVNGVPHVDP
jgi:hypothetical protein